MAKASILTPTFDREPTVKALMKWIQNQTHTDWEWWLLHDGPIPCSQSFRDAAAADPRIHCIYSHERRPIGAKTNAVISSSSADSTSAERKKITSRFEERAGEDFSWGYGFTYAYRSHVRSFARMNE